MTVGEVCKRNVTVAAKNETIVDAANHMRTFHVGDLVVVEYIEVARGELLAELATI